MYLRQHEAIASKRDMFMVDPRSLMIETNWNVRDLDSHDERPALDELKDSIRERGVLVPLEIRLRDDKDLVITAGHRRLKAVMELIAEGEPIKTVPCVPEAQNTSPEERTINLVVSNTGKPLTPLQVAEVVRRLVAFGWDKVQIAKRLGWKSTASVLQHLDMVALPESDKQRVRNGQMSASLAVQLQKEDPEFAAQLKRENDEERRKAGVGKRQTKITPRKVTAAKERAKPKSDSQPEPDQSVRQENHRGESNHRGDSFVDATGAHPLPTPASTPQPVTEPPAQEEAPSEPVPAASHSFRQRAKPILDALEPFATIAHEHDFNERSDDDVIEVPFKYLKQAWIAFASATGGSQS